ncbi:MAG: hypothetical protein H7A49_11900 [Akkermansiaceae bacterium]|nr:hypothetical protein [Akkermansiaceae bacterium]
MKQIAILFLGLAWLSQAAELKFDSAFTSHMVLQRNAPIVLHGDAPERSEVTVILGATKLPAKADAKGRWKVVFDPLPAGGPFLLTARHGDMEVQLEDVLIGDVWLFSGQSNMQMGLDEAIGGPVEIAAATAEMPVRLLRMPKAAAETAEDDIGATWQPCSPDTVRKFSAVGWFFAKHLHEDPSLAKVPLGLIDSSFGGTAIEAWTPEGKLPDIPKEKISGSMFGISPGHLFNRMIAPLRVYPIQGAVWYQGEANAGAPGVYASLLGNMIDQWRETWQRPGLPFFVVQLPAFEGTMGGLDFSWLREAEAKACAETDRAWLAVTHDTTDGFDLHPKEKEEVGRRVSLLARKNVYGRDIVAEGPRMVTTAVKGDRLIVTMDQEPVAASGKRIRGFEIAGENGDFRNADAVIRGRDVELRADGVPNPATVRYAWGAMPDADLTNRADLPAAPFRTDTRDPETPGFQPLPIFHRIETPRYSLETGRGGKVASLIAGGTEFLSREPGGGTWVPGGFGPRNLGFTKTVGPRRIALTDGGAELELACRNESMAWSFTNRGGDPIELHVALSPEVEVAADGFSATLTRNGVRIEVGGITRVEDHRLVVSAPGHGVSRLDFTFR